MGRVGLGRVGWHCLIGGGWLLCCWVGQALGWTSPDGSAVWLYADAAKASAGGAAARPLYTALLMDANTTAGTTWQLLHMPVLGAPVGRRLPGWLRRHRPALHCPAPAPLLLCTALSCPALCSTVLWCPVLFQ